jgi:LDH2 family malate/lactate/ureidoglycolate dehydrogenase
MPLGHYFLAIDVEALCPLEEFRENAGRLLRALRAVSEEISWISFLSVWMDMRSTI